MTPGRRSISITLLATGTATLLVVLLWRPWPAPDAKNAASLAERVKPLDREEADRKLEDGRWGSAHAALPPNAVATVERIQSMLGSLEPVMPGEVENAAALELLRWWAEIDPAAAIDFAVGHPSLHGRATLPVDLFVGWFDAKPAEAMKWMQRLESGAPRAQILPAVISIVAQKQPFEALRLAGELTGENRQTALSALFLEWSANHPHDAADHAMRLSDAREQNLALRQVLGKWMDVDLNAAVAWARSLPPDPAPGSFDVLPPVTGILIEKWAAHAPADAAAYLLSTPEGAGRINLLRTVAAQWAGANPNEALQWASGITNEADRNVMVRGVIAEAAQANVQRAAELALTSNSDSSVEQGLAVVFDQWSARDSAGLAQWVSGLVERTDSRAKLSTVVTAWAAADLNSAVQWLKTVPPGDARDVCCVALSQHLAPRDSRLALQWAEAISNSELRRGRIDAINRGK